MRESPRGRDALTEGDPGHSPWDRKAIWLPGIGVRYRFLYVESRRPRAKMPQAEKVELSFVVELIR
jgi:hypothetical protein